MLFGLTVPLINNDMNIIPVRMLFLILVLVSTALAAQDITRYHHIRFYDYRGWVKKTLLISYIIKT